MPPRWSPALTAQHRAEMPEAIETNVLVKSFGHTEAPIRVDLTMRQGSSFSFLGPNGAGKTTTIRILAMVLRPDGGTATVLGHDVVRDAATVRRRRASPASTASPQRTCTSTVSWCPATPHSKSMLSNGPSLL
jgi:ABC-2 type transport system ATP-binding protein